MKKIIILVLASILTISCNKDENEIIKKSVFEASEKILDFGILPVNSSSNKELTVKNTGNGDLIISSFQFNLKSYFYTNSISKGEIIIAPNKEYTFSLGFRPLEHGEFENTLIFETNVGEQQITLKGIGIILGPL
ncbi:hypothetical protein TSEDIMI_30075 [Tenacibaculum sediminilitoris]|uniref:Ig-like domain-containing protein n=1 Tax=Tenacibaculum sediminilitoris TaxID=1820334 RepID=UPI003893EB12